MTVRSGFCLQGNQHDAQESICRCSNLGVTFRDISLNLGGEKTFCAHFFISIFTLTSSALLRHTFPNVWLEISSMLLFGQHFRLLKPPLHRSLVKVIVLTRCLLWTNGDEKSCTLSCRRASAGCGAKMQVFRWACTYAFLRESDCSCQSTNLSPVLSASSCWSSLSYGAEQRDG